MKKHILRSLLVLSAFLLFTLPMFGQVATGVNIPFGPTLPTSCLPSSRSRVLYYKTGSTNGLYQCLTANAWTRVPTSSGISGLTPGTVPKALTPTTLGDSQITDNGTNVTVAPVGQFEVVAGNAVDFNNGFNEALHLSNGTASLVSSTAVEIDSRAGTTAIGDVNGAGNGTTLTVDDAAQVVAISANTVVNLADGGSLNISRVFPTTIAGSQIGAVTVPYTSVYIGNTTNNSTQLTGTFTGNRVATFPDASGTVQLVGAAGTGAILSCLSNNTVLATATGTVYSSPGNDGTPLTVTTEGNVSFPVTRAGTIRNLYVRTGTTAKTNTPVTTITIRKNGADSSVTLVLTQTVSTTSSDTTHSFSVVAGDLITVSLSTTGTAAVSTSIASLSFELD